MSDSRWATHLFYDSTFLSIWFFFLLSKTKVFFSFHYFALYLSPKISPAQINQSLYVFRNTPNMYSAQTSSFNSISTTLSPGHFQLNAYFHRKLLPANNLIILTIKIGHYTFPRLTSRPLLIHHAKSTWLRKPNISIISLSLIYTFM